MSHKLLDDPTFRIVVTSEYKLQYHDVHINVLGTLRNVDYCVVLPCFLTMKAYLNMRNII